MTELNEPWARLCTLGSTEDIVNISGTTFTIGRSTGNKFCIV